MLVLQHKTRGTSNTCDIVATVNNCAQVSTAQETIYSPGYQGCPSPEDTNIADEDTAEDDNLLLVVSMAVMSA